MKKSKLFLILLFMVILLISGCKDDSISESVFEPPIFIGSINEKEGYWTHYCIDEIRDYDYTLTDDVFSINLDLIDSTASFIGKRQKVVEDEYYYLGKCNMFNKDYIATFIVLPNEKITGRAFTEDYSEVYEIDIRDITQ